MSPDPPTPGSASFAAPLRHRCMRWGRTKCTCLAHTLCSAHATAMGLTQPAVCGGRVAIARAFLRNPRHAQPCRADMCRCVCAMRLTLWRITVARRLLICDEATSALVSACACFCPAGLMSPQPSSCEDAAWVTLGCLLAGRTRQRSAASWARLRRAPVALSPACQALAEPEALPAHASCMRAIHRFAALRRRSRRGGQAFLWRTGCPLCSAAIRSWC